MFYSLSLLLFFFFYLIYLFLQPAYRSEDVVHGSSMMRSDQWDFLSLFFDDPSFNSSHLLDTW